VEADYWIFLTKKEALDAIAIDFKQYGNQFPLFYDLVPMILGSKARVIADGDTSGVWIASGPSNRMKKIGHEKLGDFLISALNTKAYSLSQLSEICGLVFQVRAIVATCSENQPGIWIETDMNRFVCRQCGDCCQNLDYHDECTKEDYRRWCDPKYKDILDRVMVIPRKDGKTEYKLWVKPGTQTLYEICPWLEKAPGEKVYRCLIQDVKPGICREYPFTRKHAVMTGCNGDFREPSKR